MRAFLRAWPAFVLPIFLTLPVAAQKLPNGTVKLIVPFGAGGPADATLGCSLSTCRKKLKQSFVVEVAPAPERLSVQTRSPSPRPMATRRRSCQIRIRRTSHCCLTSRSSYA